jgi:cytochrome c553
MTHAPASRLAATLPCCVCGVEGQSVPAHFPHHRGMGGRKDFWDSDKWVPCCMRCHGDLDATNGSSPPAWAAHLAARGAAYAYQAMNERNKRGEA